MNTEVNVYDAEQMTPEDASDMKMDIVRKMENWHGDTLALGNLLHKFDVGGGWRVLSVGEDGKPTYKTMWDFFRGIAPKWNLSARYFYELRDQGRAQQQTNVVGWSGSSLKQLARLNEDPDKQAQVVRALKEEVVEISGDMIQRGVRPPVAKEVRNHVKWHMPNKPKKRSPVEGVTLKAAVEGGYLPRVDRSPLQLQITAVVALLSDVIDTMNMVTLGIDDHALRADMNAAQKLTEKAKKLLFSYKDIV